MKKISLIALFTTVSLFSFAQGTRLQPGGVPTPVPVYNISQIVSNVVAIIGTNSGVFTITNLPRSTSNNSWDIFPFADTNKIGTNVSRVISYSNFVAQIISVVGAGSNDLTKVSTNDSRPVNLTNANSVLYGNFNGKFQETNTAAGAGVHGLNIGLNTDNSLLTGGTPGAEILQQRLAKAGWYGIDDANLQYLWKVGISKNSDMALHYYLPLTTTYVGTLNQNEGAPATIEAPYFAGSASSLIDLPVHGPEIWAAKRHPWIGTFTTVSGMSYSSPASILLFQKVYTNLITVSKTFNTNHTVGILKNYGIQMGIWGDSGAFTNRTGSGSLRLDPAVLSAAGSSSVSNYVYQIHTNGLKISLPNYRTTFIINPWNGDTERVQTNGISTDVGYPSQVVTSTPLWPVISPETIDRDVLWYQTNYVDEMFVQDSTPFEGFVNGYEQQIFKFDYSILYLTGFFGQHIYWKNYAGGGVIPDIPPFTTPALNHGDFTNQLILGWFINKPSSAFPYCANDVSPDQTYILVGTDYGLARSMAIARLHNDSISNSPDASVFPTFTIDGDNNNSALGNLSITNALSVGEMFRGNVYFLVDTNTWTWNSKIGVVLTNAPVYMTLWQDNLCRWPTTVSDDGTNALFIRKLDNASYSVLAVNQSTTSSNFNFNISVAGGLPTNIVYYATNILAGTAFGTGLITNSFISTVPTVTAQYVQLTPVPISSGGGLLAIRTTNDFWFGTNTVNNYAWTFDTNGTFSIYTNGGLCFSVGTNGLTIKPTVALSTNSLFGPNWMTNNTAPVVPVTPGASALGFTNATGSRAIFALPYFLQDAVTGNPCGTVSNRTTGAKFIIAMSAIAANVTNMFLCPPCSPNDVWDVRNESTGTGVSFGFTAQPAQFYPTQ